MQNGAPSISSSYSSNGFDHGRRMIHAQANLLNWVDETNFERKILILDAAPFLACDIAQTQTRTPLYSCPTQTARHWS